jgi:acetoin utilization protein AcuB
MKVSKYMTRKLITVTPEMSVKEAFMTMRTHRVRHLPVVDGDRLAGMVSDRDLRRPRWADTLEDWTSYYQIDDNIAVKDVMTSNPEVLRTYDQILKAITIFREHRYGALPVLDKTGALVGILSAQDLLLALEELLMELKAQKKAKKKS